MQDAFKCTKCGVVNYLGDISCRNCQEEFSYSCPYCGVQVPGGTAKCASCGNTLYWPSQLRHQGEVTSRTKPDEVKAGSSSWMWPLIGLIIVLAIAGVGIGLFINLLGKPTQPSVVPNVGNNKSTVYVVPDNQAPMISNVQVKNINYNSVDITWNTDEPSTSQVLWKTSGGSYNQTARKDALLTGHSVEVAGLTPKTTYLFKAVSSDQFNNEAQSPEQKFDIGKPPGIARVEVLLHNLGSIEDPGQPERTFINGVLRNTGDLPLKPLDIEVIVTIEIAGRQGKTELIASIEDPPVEIKPSESRKFSITVPNNTRPNYSVIARILDR